MTEKELRRLSRKDLLEMLIEQSQELQKTQKKLHKAEERLQNVSLKIENAGSIAEASMQLNGVFESAQAACDQYLESIRELVEHQEVVCQQREDESVQKATALLAETEARCAAMEAQTKAQCEKLIEEAKIQAEAFLNAASQKHMDFTAVKRRRTRKLNAFSMRELLSKERFNKEILNKEQAE